MLVEHQIILSMETFVQIKTLKVEKPKLGFGKVKGCESDEIKLPHYCWFASKRARLAANSAAC